MNTILNEHLAKTHTKITDKNIYIDSDNLTKRNRLSTERNAG